MLAARLSNACVPLTTFVSGLSKSQSIKPVLRAYNVKQVQRYSAQPRSTRFTRRQAAKSETVTERLTAPAGQGGL